MRGLIKVKKLILLMAMMLLIPLASSLESPRDFGYNILEVEVPQIYGEMHFHNDTGTHLVVINSQGVAVNVTGFNGENSYAKQILKGFTFDGTNNALVAQVAGLYTMHYSISTGNTAGNNQEYNFVISINDIRQNNTDTHRKIGSAGDVGNVGGLGFLTLKKGDSINLQATNEDATANLEVHSANVNLMRIEP